MGPVGMIAGTGLGSMAGRWLGSKLGSKYEDDASKVGGALGGLAGLAFEPFKTGGQVKGRKGKPRIIMAHSGEWILPVGVSPTKAQKSAIEKRKKVSRKQVSNCFV